MTYRKAEKLRAKQEMAERNAAMIRQIADITADIEAKEAMEKYKEALMYAEANKQLAEDAKNRRARERQADQAASIAHVSNQRESAWLTEDPTSGLRVGGVRRDQWKGMSTSQLQAHYDAQYEQVLEKQSQMQKDAIKEAEYADNQRQIQDAMEQVVLKQEEDRLAMEKSIRLHQAEQAVRRRERENAEARTGAVTDEFFKYFGSSCR